jgi:hypothetical protein
MEFTRITAHFSTQEEAKNAFDHIKKKCPEHFEAISFTGKKVSVENDTWDLHGLNKKKMRLLLEEAADNVHHHFNDCEGLSYSVFVKR